MAYKSLTTKGQGVGCGPVANAPATTAGPLAGNCPKWGQLAHSNQAVVPKQKFAHACMIIARSSILSPRS
jgi:hypothetical protein